MTPKIKRNFPFLTANQIEVVILKAFSLKQERQSDALKPLSRPDNGQLVRKADGKWRLWRSKDGGLST